jgi:TusA-related sulfurtransferase
LPSEGPQVLTTRIDLRGVPCPLNLVKAKLAIEKAAVGDILEIQIDDGEPIQNLPVSLSRQGQEVLETTEQQGCFCLRVRRRL